MRHQGINDTPDPGLPTGDPNVDAVDFAGKTSAVVIMVDVGIILKRAGATEHDLPEASDTTIVIRAPREVHGEKEGPIREEIEMVLIRTTKIGRTKRRRSRGRRQRRHLLSPPRR